MPTSSKGRIRKCILNRRKLKRAEGTEFFFYVFLFLCLLALCINKIAV